MEDDSPAGVAYASLARSLRRRRAELIELIEAGAAPTEAAQRYQRDHPFEPLVSQEELEAARAGARPRDRDAPAGPAGAVPRG